MIYFVQSIKGGPVKIGWANNVERRLQELQTGSPVPLQLLGTMRGKASAEFELHRQFNEERSHGEWFVLSPRLEAFLIENDVFASKKVNRATDPYLKETEVAEITSLSVVTLRNHRSLGKGIPYYKIGSAVRYRLNDVVSFMERHRVVHGGQ